MINCRSSACTSYWNVRCCCVKWKTIVFSSFDCREIFLMKSNYYPKRIFFDTSSKHSSLVYTVFFFFNFFCYLVVFFFSFFPFNTNTLSITFFSYFQLNSSKKKEKNQTFRNVVNESHAHFGSFVRIHGSFRPVSIVDTIWSSLNFQILLQNAIQKSILKIISQWHLTWGSPEVSLRINDETRASPVFLGSSVH